MTHKNLIKPDYIFETGWEVCNKVGGIHTVISTKAQGIIEEYGDKYVTIGPDVWKETRQNPAFTEDRTIYTEWVQQAEAEGLHFKIGRWNIKGSPIAILVDFTPYFALKDSILADFWETYQLDSISGNWDYVEPLLFGYAAAKVIESFYEYNLNADDKIIAQFHEWMTGSGVLYLRKNTPQVGCVFTTHATVVGRSIAGNNMPLYGALNQYNGNEMAERFGVKAKHSLEFQTAHHADAFTTVSRITADECKQLLSRDPDIITPNGFDEELIYSVEELQEKRKTAREKLLSVASAVTGQQLPEDSMLLINSGRYEFRNKGIDLFIDSLADLNERKTDGSPVVAFLTIPAHHSGPVPGLAERVTSGNTDGVDHHECFTHGLFEADYDIILRMLREKNLVNNPESKVKVIYVPSYLNGNDGIFNMNYYDLLPGFDLSLFPSYYEPWGYTPLESIAFGVPTVTTTLAGFGLWMKDSGPHKSVIVIERTDNNEQEVVTQLSAQVLAFRKLNLAQKKTMMADAIKLASHALWSNLIQYYIEAYAVALFKAGSRSEQFKHKRQAAKMLVSIEGKTQSEPVWKKVLIEHSYPKELDKLVALTKNLWWCWNTEAIELFRMIDPVRWDNFEQNPIALLEVLTYNQMKLLVQNKEFMSRLDDVSYKFNAYMAEGASKSKPRVAYFSMEFGLHDSLQIFSGGLGILAGDYLKEASDSNIDMIGVGLLYRYGYFRQALSPFGEQISQYFPQRFNALPLQPVRNGNNEWVKVSIALPGRNLYAKVWKVEVGRIPLYLLDADISDNQEADRFVTHQLYGGDLDNRFKQELLLGVGGIRALKAIHAHPDIYHCNEGHAAFIGIERMRHLVQEKQFSTAQALELVRSSTLFTTHTPVPAGHDAFPEDMLRAYIPHYAVRLNMSWNDFMNLGRYVENKGDEKFSMSVLAAKLSQEMNGVSRIHGRVSREMFRHMYHGFYENELHIGYVTNGVHYPTWASQKWQTIYKEYFGVEFLKDQSNDTFWKNINNVPDALVWKTRNELRLELVQFIKKRLQDTMGGRQDSPRHIIDVIESLDENALIIGFARRFATYKRAHLLFSNLERLDQIISVSGKPVIFVYAGKAHPADKAGSDLIKRIIEVSRMPQFIGKVIFLENYGMEMAKKLVQGVDIWLNTPTRPLEASGTSGEKAIMNGVVNFSVLDGWWAEGYKPGAGWALKEERTYQNQQFQDELDSETIYNILEDEIIPTFYDRNKEGIPVKWVSFVKNTISGIAPHFTMRRQLEDYISQYYLPLFERVKMLKDNDYDLTRKLASWKYKVQRNWDEISVLEINLPDSSRRPLILGDYLEAKVVINLAELEPEDLRVEMIAGQRINDEMKEPTVIHELNVEHRNGNIVTYSLNLNTSRAGVFDLAFRITPNHELLPHRLDFNLVKWA